MIYQQRTRPSLGRFRSDSVLAPKLCSGAPLPDPWSLLRIQSQKHAPGLIGRHIVPTSVEFSIHIQQVYTAHGGRGCVELCYGTGVA